MYSHKIFQLAFRCLRNHEDAEEVVQEVMLLVWRLTDGRRRPGLLTGTFACGYALARIVGELFREPDAHLGYLWGPVTMGMVLSLPVLLVGAGLIVRAYRRPMVS